MSDPTDYERMVANDRRYVIHPFSQIASTSVDAADMYVSGSGSYIEDANGNRLFDANAGLWCVNIGYGRDEMVEAIRDQAAKMSYGQIFSQNANLPSAQLASKLADMAPEHLNRVFFSTGGSIANETAVRTIHHYFRLQGRHSKRFVITVDQSYHGSTYLAASMTFSVDSRDLFHTVDEIVYSTAAPNTYRAPDDIEPNEFLNYLIDEFERLIARLGPENVACFILEPVLGAGGVIVPPEGYHARITEVCHANEIYVIADEVVTGFGRLGHFMAAEPLFDFKTDVVTLGKGISSGYQPLAATLISDELYDGISESSDPSKLYAHGFTHSGHPICCAAGLKNIEIMEREDILGHVSKVGDVFLDRLRGLHESQVVGDVRGMGFMAAVELVQDKTSKASFAPNIDISKRVETHCRAQGLIVRPIRQEIILSPPLVMTADEGDWVADVLLRSLQQVETELRAEGALD